MWVVQPGLVTKGLGMGAVSMSEPENTASTGRLALKPGSSPPRPAGLLQVPGLPAGHLPCGQSGTGSTAAEGCGQLALVTKPGHAKWDKYTLQDPTEGGGPPPSAACAIQEALAEQEELATSSLGLS